MAISIGGNPPPPPISPLTDHPDDGCTRRWNYHRLTLWHLFVPVVVALLYMGVVDGGLKPNVAHQEAEAKRSYRAKEPLSLPLHDLLLNWAEVECGTTIPPSVHIPAFPHLTSSPYTEVKSLDAPSYLPPPFSWIRIAMSWCLVDTYPTSALQRMVAAGPPYYTLTRGTPSGYTGGMYDAYGLGVFGSLFRWLATPNRVFKHLKWFFYPFQGEKHAQARDRQMEMNSEPFILSGGGRGVYLTEPSDTDIVLAIPNRCHITADFSVRTLLQGERKRKSCRCLQLCRRF